MTKHNETRLKQIHDSISTRIAMVENENHKLDHGMNNAVFISIICERNKRCNKQIKFIYSFNCTLSLQSCDIIFVDCLRILRKQSSFKETFLVYNTVPDNKVSLYISIPSSMIRTR